MDNETREALNRLRSRVDSVNNSLEAAVEALGLFMEETNGRLLELEERINQANELRSQQLGQVVENLIAEVRADRNEYRQRLEILEGLNNGE